MQLSKVMTFGLTLALVATVIAPLSARAEGALSAAPSDNGAAAPAAVAPALSAAPQSNEAPAPASNPSGSGSPLSSAGQTNEAAAPAAPVLNAAPQSNEVKSVPSNPSGSGNPAAAPQSNEVATPSLTAAPQSNEVNAPNLTAAPQSNEVKTPATPTTPTTPSGASSGSGAPASGGGGGNGPISGSFGGNNGGGASAITPGSTGGITGGSITTTAGVCAPIITSTLKIAGKNDASQVRRVQNFLNAFEKANIAVTGVYDTATIEAVEDFQVKYRSEVLAPWGATLPSGEIYITTRNKMNDMYCGTKATLTAAESAKIAAFRAAITAGGIVKNTDGQLEITNPENGTTVPAEIGANTSSTTVAQKPGFFRNTASAIMAVPKAIGSFFSKLFKRN